MLRRAAFPARRGPAVALLRPAAAARGAVTMTPGGVPRMPGGAGRGTAFEPQVIGSVDNGPPVDYTVSESELRDIVGVPALAAGAGGAPRIPAGELLSMIDTAAVGVIMRHLHAQPALAKGKPLSVATVAMDELSFREPVLHGDVVSLKGRVVDVGRSSAMVALHIERAQFPTGAMLPVARATVSMVCIDESLAVQKVVPPLLLSDEAALMWSRLARASRQRAVETAGFIKQLYDADDVDPGLLRSTTNSGKRHLVPMDATRHWAQRLFMPRDLNFNDTVFGGEILRWMEANAVHCGQRFCGQRGVVCVGMHSVEFKAPIYKKDWIELQAHVVYVRNTTMEIDVELTTETEGRRITTNRASFVVMSIDGAGRGVHIDAGLEVAGASLKWQRRYAMARRRYYKMRAAKDRSFL